jgi:hypothetical protein
LASIPSHDIGEALPFRDCGLLASFFFGCLLSSRFFLCSPLHFLTGVFVNPSLSILFYFSLGFLFSHSCSSQAPFFFFSLTPYGFVGGVASNRLIGSSPRVLIRTSLYLFRRWRNPPGYSFS